jgi:hypothetical protein
MPIKSFVSPALPVWLTLFALSQSACHPRSTAKMARERDTTLCVAHIGSDAFPHLLGRLEARSPDHDISSVVAMMAREQPTLLQCPVTGLSYQINPDAEAWRKPRDKKDVALYCPNAHSDYDDHSLIFVCIDFEGTVKRLPTRPPWSGITSTHSHEKKARK